MHIFLYILTNNIIPIFILIGLGVLLGRKFSIDIASLSKFNFYALLPAFTFVVIYSKNLSTDFGKTLIFLLIAMAVTGILVFITAGLRRMPNKRKYALMNAALLFNSGNIGIPLITLMFRDTPYLDQALIIQVTVMLIQSIATNTIGFYNAGRGNLKWQQAVISLLKMPTLWAIVAAIILKGIHFDLTATFLWPPLLYLKEALIGFVLTTLGIQLSRTNLRNVEADVSIAVVIRLIAAPLISFVILKLGGYSGVIAQVLLISSAAPAAINTALMAVEMNNEAEFAAKVVAFSTIFCSVTFVIVIYLAQILFPV